MYKNLCSSSGDFLTCHCPCLPVEVLHGFTFVRKTGMNLKEIDQHT